MLARYIAYHRQAKGFMIELMSFFQGMEVKAGFLDLSKIQSRCWTLGD